MTDQTPVETVTEAIRAVDRRAAFTSDVDLPRDRAHAALASLAQHRDDIARVLLAHRWDDGPFEDGGFTCICGFATGPGHDVTTSKAFTLHIVDAVLAYLTGGAR